MGTEREKEWFLPEAQDDAFLVPWPPEMCEAEETLPDPWLRPDVPDEEDLPLMPCMPEMPAQPCPCCGVDIPADPSPGYICPMCWWEIDDFTQDEDEPSDQNHGLSLAEAQMNYRAFGICDPWLTRQNENEE